MILLSQGTAPSRDFPSPNIYFCVKSSFFWAMPIDSEAESWSKEGSIRFSLLRIQNLVWTDEKYLRPVKPAWHPREADGF